MLYLFIIFIGAFLLFQVQPLIAKLILPIFGGGAAIWTACLLFFQAFLLLGYLYSHLLTKLSTIKQQAMVHFVLLATSLIFVPISLAKLTEHNVADTPLANILMLLMATVGLPYFLLASTGPLVQRWLTYVESDKLPYKLYSLSNIASLVALISYPFLFEPLLVLSDQILFWSLAYVIFVLAFIGLTMSMLKQKNLVITSAKKTVEVTKKQGDRTQFDGALWLLLSMVGVVLLVSTTNAMTQNIPPVPFLWILPLCIYLLTFIISFHSPRWYVRWYWFVLFVISSFAAIFMYFIGSGFDIISQILIYSVILFSACMLCHGELARLKPEAEKLTFYYLMMSLGGFLGSAFVAFVAQKVFSQFLEFPLAIFSVYLLFAICLLFTKKLEHIEHKSHATTARYLPIASLSFMVVVIIFFSYLNALFAQTNVTSSRNFYGILTVKDVDINNVIERRLIDGSTSHGTQILAKAGADLTPRSYYRANTGVALALAHVKNDSESINVGIVGLGAGTLAAYGRKGDLYDFYELNPDVLRLANDYFTYLKSSQATTHVILGDGRVSLANAVEQERYLDYDVLVIDAFSGDSIPNHLLTQEAFDLYFQHLSDQGILAIHISNSHLDLTPLVRGLAQAFNKQAIYVNTLEKIAGENNAEWVLVTNNKDFLANASVRRFVSRWPLKAEKTIVWTDDYSNLLSVLK